MIRLDVYLSESNFVKSRQKAKSLIEDGFVRIDSVVITKPSYLIDELISHNVEISDPCPYVSRGGLKLEKVINDMKLSFVDKIAIDIGASTGGFTDCLLKHGAKTVYAIDSGANQLDLALARDSRVVSIENYNARNISIDDIGTFCDVITIDVSFISQTYILPKAIELLNKDGLYISLIKPQFEAGRDKIDKGGIVKKPENRFFSVKKVIDCANEKGLYCSYFAKSPILGGDGNTEYLAVFSKRIDNFVNEKDIKKIIFDK